MGKRLATNFYETQNKGEVGRDMLFSLDKLAAMDDLDTDALAPLRLSVGQLANAVNIPDETIEKYLNASYGLFKGEKIADAVLLSTIPNKEVKYLTA